MHRDIARLFFAHTATATVPAYADMAPAQTPLRRVKTDFLGMKDAIKLPAATLGAAEGWNYDDTNTLRNAASINALGYENLWGNVSEMDGGLQFRLLGLHPLKDQGRP